MDFDKFVSRAQSLPVVLAEYFSAGQKDSLSMEVQLSRWKTAGKIIKLKRGVYLLADSYRKQPVFEFYIAGVLKQPSYVSLEKAFEFYNLIPEPVNTFTCVTPQRPALFETPVGRFEYRHIQEPLFWGYQSVTLHGQTAFMARPEKALLDFFYLYPYEPDEYYLREMRLQNLDSLDPDRMREFAHRSGKPKLRRAAEALIGWREKEREAVRSL